MECLGLHNKPKAEVHPGHKLTGPKEEEEEEEEEEEAKSWKAFAKFQRMHFIKCFSGIIPVLAADMLQGDCLEVGDTD
jgi:hypothetical protein